MVQWFEFWIASQTPGGFSTPTLHSRMRRLAAWGPRLPAVTCLGSASPHPQPRQG